MTPDEIAVGEVYGTARRSVRGQGPLRWSGLNT